MMIKISSIYKYIYQKISKTTDIIKKFNSSNARVQPFLVFFLPFCCLFLYSHYKIEFFIISSNMSPYMCNVMGDNQHAHTHFSKIIRSE